MMRKKLTAMLVCVLLVLSLLPATALADDIDSDGYNDHDYNAIRSFLETEVDGVKNGLRVATAYNADDPATWEVGFIEDDGEKYVYSINWLDKGLSGTLDLSNFTEITYINCESNSLTGLDVTNDTKLGQIYIENNQITSLDLSTNSGLSYLYCNDNALTTLDTPNTGDSLWVLHCYRNNLTSIDVSANTGLEEFYCSENDLTALNVSGLSELTKLECTTNALTTLNLTGCSALSYINCCENALTTLDLTGLSALINLYCNTNALTSLALDDCTNLESLGCDDNWITSLDLSGITKVTSLTYSGNTLISLNFGSNPVSSIDCSKCGLTALDLSALTTLTDLTCSENNLTSLKVGANVASLECNNCGLSTLDLSTVTALADLECNDNNLTTLNLSKNTLLEGLECNGNRLSTLDLSKNTLLDDLVCCNNCLSALDLTHNPDINYLDMQGNPLKQIDASINGASISITAKDGGYAELYYDDYDPTLFATAVPVGPAVFYNWTNGAAEAAATAKYDLPMSSNVDLDVNFLLLKGSLADGKIKCGGSITLTPSISGGTWSCDSAYLSRNGNVFTGIKPGATRVTYTISGKDVGFDITISQGKAVGLSCTKTDATVFGGANGSVMITATGGDSGTYEYSLNSGAWQSANVFGGLVAGNYTAAVRDAANISNTALCSVAVGQPSHMGSVPAKKAPTKANAGTAITVTPPAAPRGYTLVSVTYSSSNPSVATVDANGNVTFLAGGKAAIITKSVYQMTDSKGKVKTKTTTVKKAVTVKQPVASVALNMADATVMRTQKVKLTAAISPATASNKKLSWKSSNPKVAAVSSAGVVTGKAVGSAVITCTAKDGSGAAASCTVTVSPIAPTALKLSKAALTVKTGKTASLKATMLPKNADNKTVTWQSSNPAVVTVDAKGKVKAIAPGTAVITVTLSNGLTALCTVTVK